MSDILAVVIEETDFRHLTPAKTVVPDLASSKMTFYMWNIRPNIVLY